MKLRSGNKYTVVHIVSISNIVIVQSIIRGFISRLKYRPILLSIKLIKKTAPHLYNYKLKSNKIKKVAKSKKVSKSKKIAKSTKVQKYLITNLDKECTNNDLQEIINQYDNVKNLGRINTQGLIRSKRTNKGKNPIRYIDPNFKKIFMEENTVDDFLGSDSDDKDSDDSDDSDDSEIDDIEYSGEEINSWDSEQELNYSEYEDY